MIAYIHVTLKALLSCGRSASLSILADRSMVVTDFVVATSVPFLMQIIIWSAIFDQGSQCQIGVYSKNSIFFYYGCALILSRFNNGYDVIRILSRMIHDGSIDSIMLRPILLPLRQFGIFVGESVIYLSPVLIITVFSLARYGGSEDIFLLSMVIVLVIFLSQLVAFLIAFALAVLAFWFVKSDFLASLHIVLMTVFGGTLLPATLWPELMVFVMVNNPFYLQIGAIANLLVSPSISTAVSLAFDQIAWIICLFVMCVSLWKSGGRRLMNIGG